MKKIVLTVLGLFMSIIGFKSPMIKNNSVETKAKVLHEEEIHDVSTSNDLEGSFNSTKTFSFLADSISQIEVTGEGFEYSASLSEENVCVTYSNFSAEACSIIKFVFGNDEKNVHLFFYRVSDLIYYSFLSKDSLMRYMGVLTDETCDNDELDAVFSYSEGTSCSAKARSNSSSHTNISIIHGYLKWKNSANNEFPLAGMKVKVETSIGRNYETFTTDDGYYIIYLYDVTHEVNPFSDVTVHVYAKSEYTSVVHNETTLYEKCWSGIDLSQYTSAYNLSYTFSPRNDNDLGEAMQIAQAAKYYSDYIKSLNNDVGITQCRFNYPNNSLKGCYYSSKTQIVYITSQDNKPDKPYSYESWDVIGHEYGHHIQHVFSISDNPGGSHNSSKNNADTQVNNSNPTANNKVNGLKLAWGESWPTFWAITAQQTFPDDIKTINTVADTNYTSYNGADYSLDTYDPDGIKGEGCERAIMRFLYKIYSNSTDEKDKFALGDAELWNIVETTRPYYFYQFVSALYSNGYSKSDLGLLLETYGMSASNLTISNSPTATTVPMFTWAAKGGSVYFPNDLFTLSFYNQNKVKILDITGVSANQYSLTSEQWYSILHSYGSKYYLMIESYASNYLSTGPYYSTFYEFSKPNNSSELTSSVIIINRSRYYEKSYDILPNSSATLNIAFENSGYKVLQTFGASDIYMSLYSSDGTTLLASNDDDGYGLNAWIYYYFNSPATYIIKIRSYNQNNSAKTKLSITPAHNFVNTSNSSLASYDCIWHISNTTNYYLTAYGEQYYSAILTFTPTQTGKYTINLTSEFDNYLYVIDPRSYDPISPNADYNNDSSGTNASLTKSLSAGIKYYIVFSQFNPSHAMDNLDEYDNCYVHIYLN